MLLTWTGETVTVRQQGHAVSVTAVDEVERGGLSLQKTDTITGTTPQATLILRVSLSKSSIIPGIRLSWKARNISPERWSRPW